MDIISIVIMIIAGVVVMSPVLWIVGRMLVGSKNAKFTDAVTIIVLGVIADALVGLVLQGIVATIVEVVVYCT